MITNHLLSHSRYVFITLALFHASENLAHDNTSRQLPELCQRSDSNPHCGYTPSSVYDAEDRLWTVYVDGGHIMLVTSADHGTTFSPAVKVNAKAEVISADGENRPKLALGHNAEVYVSWTQKTKGRYTGDIRFARSVDGGKTFSAPITINDDGLLTSHRYDSLSVMENGDVYLIWLDKRHLVAAQKAEQAYNGSAVYYTVSKDNGVSFAPNQKIADHSCECCRVITDQGPDGQPIVLWRHIFGENIRDHAINVLDGSDNIRRVTFDNWQIDACPHHGPDMLVDQQTLHLVWFTGKDGKAGLHYANYDLARNTLQDAFHIDSSPLASRPQIALFDQRLYIVWKRVEDNRTVLNMINADVHDRQWSEPKVIADSQQSSDHPQLMQNERHLSATWWSEDKGMQVVRLTDNIEPQSLKAFNKTSIDAIKQRYAGEEFLMVLWSLDCPPCFEEMALLEQYKTRGKLPRLVLITTNGEQDTVRIQQMLAEFSLDKVDNWFFAGIEEQLRYSIDPGWYGELPRSYYFKADGSRSLHRGLLKEETLNRWLSGADQS